jgi:hypothetical protein
MIGEKTMKLLCTTVFTLAITTASFADIYQYADCDGNGTLLLTELDATPCVNLSDLYLGCADLTDANLNGANLFYADLYKADLRDANLTNANLTGADLYSADLHYANLTGAYLYYADLFGADLTDANLNGANLTGANYWETAIWAGATYNNSTIFPEGMNPEKVGMIYDDTPVEIDGACCVTSGCGVVEETMCVNFGGTWISSGSCDDCVAPPETCDADLDGDGEVKVADLLLLIGAWGVCP